MRSLWKLTLVEAKLYLREPVATFFTLIFPLMMLFIFGSIYGNEPTPYFGGRGSVDVSVPAYAAMIIATVGLLSIAISIAVYREKGILRRYRATPLRPRTILMAEVLVNFAITLLGIILLVAAAKVVYNLHFEGDPLSVLVGFTLAALSFFSMGFIIAGLAPTARVAQVVGMVLFYPMLFLSGATIPLQELPEAIRSFSKFLPLTHVVTLLQGLWFGEPWGDHLTEVAVLVGILVTGAVAMAWTFRWE
ncbi:MAG TPA: ABC transporter permease [Thermoflexia bacterium]|nr:ABC transporter permease [Thermoflexia bacterium]